VSRAGGNEPHWSTDGKALFFTQAASMMMVDVEPGSTFNHAKPRELFVGVAPYTTDSGQTYVVAPTGDRFLMLRTRENPDPPEIRVILNWFKDLKAIGASK
jgi:hypothetical protein